ncbi:MAG: ParB N-terminal domain-containing protein [Parcubacteria group bacterium]|nr:ParB N-terminal domain-containing protein [Parcubacteria group bacterium]
MSPIDAANYAVKNVATSDIMPELQSLAQEARKYKSADEFLKAEHPAFPAKKEFAFEQEKGISYITKDTKPHGTISVDSPILVPSEDIGKEVIDKAKVEQFKKRIAKGEKFPPIGVRYSKDKNGYFLEIVDGHHRLTAAQEMGIKEIPFVFDTKRSLTEFYNQAVGEVSKPTETLKAALKKKPAVEESAKSISQLENESAIAELKAKYKNVESKNVPISEVRNFPSAEGQEIIENAKKEILAGKKYPLVLEQITKGKNAGKYKVLDGNYRAQAYKELGIKEAPAITQSSVPIFEQGKSVTTPVIRQAQKGFESTDKFRGGTWYSTDRSDSGY